MKKNSSTLATLLIAVLAIGKMSFRSSIKDEGLVSAQKYSLTQDGKPILLNQTAHLTAAVVAVARIVANAAVDAALELSPEALTIFILGGDNSSKSVRIVSNAKYVDEMTKIKMQGLDSK